MQGIFAPTFAAASAVMVLAFASPDHIFPPSAPSSITEEDFDGPTELNASLVSIASRKTTSQTPDLDACITLMQNRQFSYIADCREVHAAISRSLEQIDGYSQDNTAAKLQFLEAHLSRANWISD